LPLRYNIIKIFNSALTFFYTDICRIHFLVMKKKGDACLFSGLIITSANCHNWLANGVRLVLLEAEALIRLLLPVFLISAPQQFKSGNKEIKNLLEHQGSCWTLWKERAWMLLFEASISDTKTCVS